MPVKSTKIQLRIECTNKEVASIIVESLEPENKQLDEHTQIKTKILENCIIIELETSAKLSSLRHTIDDIIHTISTIEEVYKTIKK
ncbi:MAG: KEOPS complex subunit Pcc1 [Candidatus Heimdallarchaeaceae archaeon]|jgi:tRNA threonylcarbamoyladenosine modification (KEOPS) complex  Pcc1 subunit